MLFRSFSSSDIPNIQRFGAFNVTSVWSLWLMHVVSDFPCITYVICSFTPIMSHLAFPFVNWFSSCFNSVRLCTRPSGVLSASSLWSFAMKNLYIMVFPSLCLFMHQETNFNPLCHNLNLFRLSRT